MAGEEAARQRHGKRVGRRLRFVSQRGGPGLVADQAGEGVAGRGGERRRAELVVAPHGVLEMRDGRPIVIERRGQQPQRQRDRSCASGRAAARHGPMAIGEQARIELCGG